jgi:ubiquinone biosynthesis protein
VHTRRGRAGADVRPASHAAGATGTRAGEFSLAAFATRLFDLQRRYGIYAAPEFAFPLLALLVIEGMVNELDRDVDFQALAVPVLMRAIDGSSGTPQEVLHDAVRAPFGSQPIG